ncbi:MAG: hypothetical protein B7Z72_08425, partial [Gemmatimonadetes bacterium 21-71-4]
MNENARQVAESLFRAAIAGADPVAATAAAVARIPTARHQRLWVFAVGKAARAMAEGAASALQRSLLAFAGGLIVSPEGGPSPSAAVTAMIG